MKRFVLGAAAVLACATIALPGWTQTTQRAHAAQIARGKYLVQGVTRCGDCHTPVNNRGVPIAGQELKGSTLRFQPLAPVPGWAAVAPGIAGLPGMTTQDAVRLLMTGLGPDGKPMRPPMPPYRLNRADAEAVAVYLKSLP